jgi:myo-inositol-1(or 4)-monophosphatase
MNYNEFTRLSLKAALSAGEILHRHFSKKIRIDYKGRIDPVTEADRSSQDLIFKLVRKQFPGHALLGEEGPRTVQSQEYCWIIDPLDGTVNFIHGVPIFCVSIGVMHQGKMISGVVHAPLLKETFVAERGKGAWLNGRKIQVSSVNRLVRSLAVTGFPYYVFAKPQRVVRNLVRVMKEVQGIRRLGSAALDLSYVAMGRFETFWEEGLSPWDVAAGSLLVEEAGGRITDLKGGDDYLWGRNILASNGKVHRSVLRMVTSQQKKGRSKP